MSLPLLRRELRANYKMILLFLAVITLYSTLSPCMIPSWERVWI